MVKVNKNREKALKEKEQKKDEDLLKKSEELGLGYVDYELPDEEANANKTIKDSFLSMIPYTQAWYEAKASEEELDNFKKIQKEKAKANDLLAMVRIGNHEEALDIMMSETNNDFFYFNKLRDKKTKEGNYVEVELEVDPFKDLNKANRIRRAVNLPFDMVRKSKTIDLSITVKNAKCKTSFEQLQYEMRNVPCSWKLKISGSEKGLICVNARMTKRITTAAGTKRGQKAQSEILSTCAYHCEFCVGNHIQNQKILIPNEEALCIECYIDKFGNKPKYRTLDKCEGVQIDDGFVGNRKPKKLKSQQHTIVEEDLEPDDICRWRPVGFEKHGPMRFYECTNKIFHDERADKLFPYCAYHVKQCVRYHSNALSQIDVPNKYGLCNVHHMSEHGELPASVHFPYPGMMKKASATKDFERGHWASPPWQPEQPVKLVPYRQPTERGFAERMGFIFRRWLKGAKSAVIIQKNWRRYVCKNKHIALRFQRSFYKRLKAVLTIQRLFRRMIAVRYARAIARRIDQAIRDIQRFLRGCRCRHFFKVLRSVRVLQRICKRFRVFRLQNAVLCVCMLIKSGKAKMRKKRVDFPNFAVHLAGQTLVESNLLPMIAESGEAAIEKQMDAVKEVNKFASLMANQLVDISCDKTQIYIFSEHLKNCVGEVQRMIRGFLGRRHVKYLQKAMLSWCPPEVASDLFRRHLEGQAIYMNKNELMKTPQHRPLTKAQLRRLTRKRLRDSYYVRKFLPPALQDCNLAEIKFATSALRLWYQSTNTLLLRKEEVALLSLFRDTVENSIKVSHLDDYISMHTKACSIHGRTVCGDCYFLRECNFPRCKCSCYRGDEKQGTACLTCIHQPYFHRICPMQLHPSQMMNEDHPMENVQLLLDRVRHGDISLPESLNNVGMSIESALVKPLNPYALMGKHLSEKADEHDKRVGDLVAQDNADGLIQKLTKFKIDADTMEFNRHYWEQTEMDLMTAESTGIQGFNIVNSSINPPLQIEETKFWSHVIAKNPNKSRRNYDEFFEHNMPFPVVHNHEIVYTVEGPKLYINILVKLASMENKKNLYDDADFLRLICDHVQIFERHWRKMVVDTREGKLNRNVNLSSKERRIYESTCIPRPQLALRLDNTFRHLGFHQKALGKDIIVHSYAERKNVSVSVEFPPVNHNIYKNFDKKVASLDDSIVTRNIPKALSRLPSKSAPSKPNLKDPIVAIEAEPPLQRLQLRRPSEPAVALQGRKGLDGKFEITTMGTCIPCRTTKHSKAQLRKEILLSLGSSVQGGGELSKLKGKEVAKIMGGPNRKLPGVKRRNSDSDILHPVEIPEIHKQYYDQNTAARGAYDEIMLATEGKRFLCPFPSCGQSFPSKEAAFLHIPDHEQRMRLAAPTPLSDSHLHFYWPKGAPWMDGEKYTDRTLPPGAIPCPFDNCRMIFSEKTRLNNHMRLAHGDFDLSHVKKGFFAGNGAPMSVPPFEPPSYAPVLWCPYHITASGKCIICIEVENGTGPRAPVKYFECLQFDFERHNFILSKIQEILDSQEDHNNLRSALSPLEKALLERFPNGEYDYRLENSIAKFQLPEQHRGLYIATTYSRLAEQKAERIHLKASTSTAKIPSRKKDRQKEEAKVIWQGRPMAFGLDKYDVGWVAAEPLMTYAQLGMFLGNTALRELIPLDTNRKSELIALNATILSYFPEPLPPYLNDITISASGSICKWVKIHDVIGRFSCVFKEPDEFKAALKAHTVPRNNSYFIRGTPSC